MKQVILTMVGMILVFYTITIGFSVFSTQTRKNELENNVARIVEAALTKNCQIYGEQPIALQEKEISFLKQNLIEEITASIGEDVLVQILAFDMEKGIVSVRVEETYEQFNGKTKAISCEKTVILEQRNIDKQMVIVQFLVEEELYKEYQLVKGEICPLPKLPEGGCLGWGTMDAASSEVLEEIGEVWEDAVYVAIFE